MKKEYLKPSMTVYELKQKPQILVGSGEKSSPRKYDDEFGYIPGVNSDLNKLA